jgi:predicted phage baseplate assembly protein
MLTALSETKSRPALRKLLTREDDDLSIALLDAWALIADVLTFYQERTANESYLGTATERRSIAYLADLVGYHLKPGVAASTYLAFTVDQNTGSAVIDKGTQVKSLPSEGGLPQTFETTDTITARAAWNKFKPRLTQPQVLSSKTKSVTVKGIDTQVKKGDSLLIVFDQNKDPLVMKVSALHPDPKAGNTRIVLTTEAVKPPTYIKKVLGKGQYISTKYKLTETGISQQIKGKSWLAADFFAMVKFQNWSLPSVIASIGKVAKILETPSAVGVYAFRKRAAIFGHNAPHFDFVEANLPASTPTWENRTLSQDAGSSNYVHLDSTASEIIEGSWVVLQSPTAGPFTYKVRGNEEISKAKFTISARVARLSLDKNSGFSSLKMRDTTVLAQSEKLTLVDLPIPNVVADDRIQLDSTKELADLKAECKLIISGSPSDNPAATEREAATVDQVRIEDGYIELELKGFLSNRYLRSTVTMTANVASATHGETRQEILGSGDGRVTHQQFKLKSKPLTYTSASTPSGTQTSLEVRVNDVRWREAPDLARLGSKDRQYITRINDDGNTTITFGDGDHGIRLPSGTENIKSTYRSGSGLDGILSADILTLLSKRPPGVTGVTNPLPATGGSDAESGSKARINVPLSALTLGRVVSLQDYADFTRAFVGVEKALATRAWQGQTLAVFLTIAGPKGAAIPDSSTTYKNLVKAIRLAGDPTVPLHVASFWPAWFQLEASIMIHSDYNRTSVLAEVEKVLRSSFSFEARQFGQDVTVNEVIAIIQNIKGVVAVDIDNLYRTGDSRAWNAVLPSGLPRPGGEMDQLQPAELLLLDPRPITWGVMK